MALQCVDIYFFFAPLTASRSRLGLQTIKRINGLQAPFLAFFSSSVTASRVYLAQHTKNSRFGCICVANHMLPAIPDLFGDQALLSVNGVNRNRIAPRQQRVNLSAAPTERLVK
jgi:hypothetical protein